MICLKPLGVMILILGLFGILRPVAAGEPQQRPADDTTGNIQLKRTEITESLDNIIETLRLRDTEITGSLLDELRNNSLQWKNPTPFVDEGDDLSRGLIDPFYTPLDRSLYEQKLESTRAIN